jgi:geranylgeranyl reductase family protein
MEYLKVAIVGAGPAGSNCALELAQKGANVCLFDNSHPREKVCGGGISDSVVERFPFVSTLDYEQNAIRRFKIIFADKIQTTILPHKAFNASRKAFDNALLNLALKNGARIIKERVISVNTDSSGNWIIRTSEGLFSAEIIVGADGVNSIVRRKIISPIPPSELAITCGYLIKGSGNESTIVLLNQIPGYIWVFPHKNTINIGIGSQLRHGAKIKRILNEFLSKNYPQTAITSKYAALIPSAENPDFFSINSSGRNWLLIGDAAGHVDPITHEGILYALWSGKLAAKAISHNSLQEYDLLWRNEYGHYLAERCRQKPLFYNPLTRALLFSGKNTCIW